VQRVLTTCAGQPPSPGSRQTPPPAVRTALGASFASDESLLVEERLPAFDGDTIGPSPGVTRLLALVRVGDLVATVLAPQGATPDDARELRPPRPAGDVGEPARANSELGLDVPPALLVAEAFTELAGAI
jgi:hypothetical protein